MQPDFVPPNLWFNITVGNIGRYPLRYKTSIRFALRAKAAYTPLYHFVQVTYVTSMCSFDNIKKEDD